MARIRIVDVPPGEAPQWVRQQWVGLELPIIQPRTPPKKMGVKTGKPVEDDIEYYAVRIDAALNALFEKNPEAAKWFQDNLVSCDYLGFPSSVCGLIE